MNRFSCILAWRYLGGAKRKKSISTMIGISFVSILIGSFSLTLTLAIMNGFEVVTHERLQSIHSQIIIRAFGNPINFKALQTVLQDEFPEIESLSPSTLQQVIIQNPLTDDISTVVAFKGIIPETEAHINALEKKLIPISGQQQRLQQVIKNSSIVIGQKLADSLDIDIGDEITLLFAPDEPRRKKINLTQQKAIVGGFFSTGIEEFDTNLTFGTLNFLHRLFPDAGITQVHIRLKKGIEEQCIIQKLRNRLGIEVYSWKDLYPALVSALKLEKYVMFCILALISLIASMNIISLLFMQINQKRGDIAILKAMGMSNKSIRSIFICMGLSISVGASLIGIGLACITIMLLERYPFITLPDAYFVTHLPVHLEWQALVIIINLVLFLSLIAIWIPLKRSEQSDITHILRYNI